MTRKIYRIPAVLAMCLCATAGVADQAPNPRSAVSVDTNTARSTSAKVMKRGDGTATSVVSRGDTASARSVTNSTARSATAKSTVARTGRKVNVIDNTTNRSAASMARSATVPARAATTAKSDLGRSVLPGITNNARSASKTVSNLGMARAANMARATAVFNDISKIGGGYSQCRDAYATCMDQFCANANDTFRRCYCSDKYTQFQETEATFEEIKSLLQSFEDNDLNAVDKTAAEVTAMYVATVGEKAIKKDVSAASEKLSSITDLLSGKKKISQPQKQSEKKTLDFSSLTTGFTFDMEDIWGGGSFDSMFDTGSKRGGVDMTEMSGKTLYNESNKQCLEIVGDTCSSNAVLNMATSSYTLMINQDCNLYEKKLDTQRQAIQNTVREAEKMLRTARLEEHRAHNSPDVNACLSKVRDAMLMDTACGQNYKRCMDPTGLYISPSTGEPIYKPYFFKLVEVINLYDENDSKNADFDKFLDTKKTYANTALDSCRGIADTVWSEFKRSAIIEIAQAQDAKIEEVKNSCVATMGECYDTKSGGLKDLDTTSAQSAGAIAANAARAMCAEKVATCAALFVPSTQAATECEFNNQGQIKNATSCGLGALLDYVATIDSTKIAEGCSDAMSKYAQELCAPSSSDSGYKYPWGCRNIARHDLAESLLKRASVYCNVTTDSSDTRLADGLSSMLDPVNVVERLTDAISTELTISLRSECQAVDGIWVDSEELEGDTVTVNYRKGTYSAGSNTPTYTDDTYTINKYGFSSSSDYSGQNQLVSFLNAIGVSRNAGEAVETYGICMENSVLVHCNAQAGENNEYAHYDSATDTCVLTDAWYEKKCEEIGGYFEGEVCYIAEE